MQMLLFIFLFEAAFEAANLEKDLHFGATVIGVHGRVYFSVGVRHDGDEQVEGHDLDENCEDDVDNPGCGGEFLVFVRVFADHELVEEADVGQEQITDVFNSLVLHGEFNSVDNCHENDEHNENRHEPEYVDEHLFE